MIQNSILSLRGFNNPKVQAFVKVGGSLAFDLDKYKRVAETLELASEKHRIVVFPGGGPVDKLIESIDRKHPLKPQIPHHACALAQDQTGLILTNFSAKLVPVSDFEHLKDVLDERKVPVLLPSKLILALGIFEKSFDITSDSIGAYFASLLESEIYVLLKSIDGIKKTGTNKILGRISAGELIKLSGDAVDAILPNFIQASKLRCWLINGEKPERLVHLLDGKATKGTQITPE